MLSTLITSKTRLKLILKFFLNPGTLAHLRGLEQEFGESTNAIRLELNKFEEAGMLTSAKNGNRKEYTVNTEHPLYSDVNNIVRKYFGLDQLIEQVIQKLGGLHSVYLTGELANGKNTAIIDIVLIGNQIDKQYLNTLIEKAESLINKKIRYLCFQESENFTAYLEQQANMLLWNAIK